MRQTIRRTYYAIKRPRPDRRRFQVTVKIVPDDGPPSYPPFSDPRVDAINAAFLAGHQSEEKSFLQLQELVKQLKEEQRPKGRVAVFSQENLDLVARYWEKRYAHRRLVDPRSMRGDLDRAVQTLGIIPLASASREELQRQVNQTVRGRKQRRVVQRLNELLKWLKRDVELTKDRKEPIDVRYLSLPEFEKVAEKLPSDEIRALAWTLFGTGARFGEAFALTQVDETRGVALITGQRRGDWTLDGTKTLSQPKAAIVTEAIPWVLRWVREVDEETKRRMRHMKARDFLKPACREVFPRARSKWVTWHDLRHSYAIYLADHGANVQEIAGALGDTEQTVRDHYGTRIRTDEAVDHLVRKLKKA